MACAVLSLSTVENSKDELWARPDAQCKACASYARAIETLTRAGVPFLVGGGFAVEVYVDAPRARIKDLDLFLKPTDVGTALQALTKNGFQTKLHEPGWLAKAFDGEDFIDLIYATRNELLTVDDACFAGAPESEVLGHKVRLQPVEELLASKVFVAARDRFDVSDVSHLILKCAARMDWQRLIDRLASHIEMLHVHLLLFQYLYPGQRQLVPPWVFADVQSRAAVARSQLLPETASRGLALDPVAFAIDIERWGFFDARRPDRVGLQRPAAVEDPTRAAG